MQVGGRAGRSSTVDPKSRICHDFLLDLALAAATVGHLPKMVGNTANRIADSVFRIHSGPASMDAAELAGKRESPLGTSPA
jgi:hypothetical protein